MLAGKNEQDELLNVVSDLKNRLSDVKWRAGSFILGVSLELDQTTPISIEIASSTMLKPHMIGRE